MPAKRCATCETCAVSRTCWAKESIERFGDSATSPLPKGEGTAAFLTLPSYEAVVADKPTFAEATKLIHNETNPYNARGLIQFHDKQAVVCNPPCFPISQAAMDAIYALPYTRRPHPSYKEKIPAFEMIKDSVTIMRLLRRLYVLLDHDASGADHSVTQPRFRHRRD